VALPRSLARFNRVVTNRVTRPFAAWLPGFAVVEHTGRRTGTHYRTPVGALRRDCGFVIVLTYTHRTDWYANVVAAGGAQLVHRGRRFDVERPELLTGEPAQRLFPALLRPLLAALHVHEALRLAVKEPTST
jgi:deazaflavin-dependent oxidoreductase (nitroreductase family)